MTCLPHRALIATLVALATLLGAVPAHAAQLEVTGAGFGHQIGLSQWGAQGGALAGASARQILTTYYRGTSLERSTPPSAVRVGVGRDDRTVRLTARGTTAAVAGHAGITAVAAGSSLEVVPAADGRCRVRTAGHDQVGGCPTLDPRPGGRVQVRSATADGSYGRAARVQVVRDGRALDTVVEIPLEQYLYGLAEVPYSWEPAALQAQAVAGRSYATWRLVDAGADPDRGCSCHLLDSMADQVYRGHERESSTMWPRWRAAVDATAGLVVVAPGAAGTRDGVAQTFYSASSSGRTASNEEVWGGTPRTWLRSVDDPWTRSVSPHVPWRTTVSDTPVLRATGLDALVSVDPVRYTASGRTATVRVVGVRGTELVEVERTGEWLRRTLGLRSSTVRDVRVQGEFVDLAGSVHTDAVRWLAAAGITRGCNPPDNTRFCPDRPVTRAQMATFLTRALELPRAGDVTFTDARRSVHADAIARLAKAGITRGCNPPDNTRFCPDRAVTRAQMATFLTRALDLGAATERFRDVDGGDTHARNIGALAGAGITRGCNPPDNTRFCPDRAVTRAQMASFLSRALQGGR